MFPNTSSIINTLNEGKFTILILVVNVVVYFIYGFQDITSFGLLNMGANFAPFTLLDEPYRLFTSMFLHGGWLHLGMNMYSLYYLGSQVESRFGSALLIRVYFITGIFAGLASLYFNVLSISVGASGAIIGLYGYFFAFMLEDSKAKNRTSLIINFVAYLAIMTILGSQFSFDNAAHFGGVASGIALRLMERYVNKPAITSPLLVLLQVAIFFIIPRYQVYYYQAFQYFYEKDQKILSVFNSNLNDADLLKELHALKNLPDSGGLAFSKLEGLPDDVQQDTAKMMAYLGFRERQIDYFIKGISKESYIYLVDSIQYINQRFGDVSKLKYFPHFAPPQPKEAMDDAPVEDLVYSKELYDKDWFVTEPDRAEYYRLGQKDSLGDWHGFVEDYYSNGAIQMKGRYSRGLRQGIFIYYNDDSTYSSSGRYAHDESVGKWEIYYRNNRLASEIKYENGRAFVINTWDSLSNPMVINGQGIDSAQYENGILQHKRPLKGGRSQGVVEGYYEDGSLKFREWFEDGKLITGVSYAENTRNKYDVSTYLPFPDGGYDAFYDHVKKSNLLRSDSVEGKVILRFDVHHSGRIHNIRFMQRFKKEYDDYAKELLLNGPKWNPARSHGLTTISSYAEVDIDF